MTPLMLKVGSKGPDVAVWQEKLKLKADGVFGPKTEKATLNLVDAFNDLQDEPGKRVRSDGVVDGFVWRAAGLSAYARRVPVPTEANQRNVRPARQSTMLNAFGIPYKSKLATLPVTCVSPNAPSLNGRLKTRNVGPFTVTGLDKAVASLTDIFTAVQADEPELYARVKTAGMLCCRAVRGSTTNWSNHSWGTAVDILIDDMLDALGDGYCQFGLQVLARHFNNAGWYWGAEFSREDAMHFEAGEALVRSWV